MERSGEIRNKTVKKIAIMGNFFFGKIQKEVQFRKQVDVSMEIILCLKLHANADILL